jgi:hypothetical protein
LLWGLEYGKRLDQLTALREAGNKVPALDRRPDLDEGIEWLWDGYLALDKSRVFAYGQPQRIPISEIIAYSGLVGLDNEDSLLLIDIVQQLDSAHFEKLAATAKNGGTRSNNRRTSGKTRR